jgi:hypothetical protein
MAWRAFPGFEFPQKPPGAICENCANWKNSGKVASGRQFEKVLVGSGNELTQDHQGSGGSGVSRGRSALASSGRQACDAGSLEWVDRLPVQGWGHHDPTVRDLGDACVVLRSFVLDNLLKL